MSEIKFRYTVKRDNGYVFSEIFTLEEIERGAVFAWANANLVDIEQVTKEQFTGLRDKNGREIYEGDILKMENQPHETGVIEFSGNGYWIKDEFANYIPSESMCEVIGNIHKNPELLEEI